VSKPSWGQPDPDDEVLDAVMAGGDAELLNHVRTHANPTRVLAALLDELPQGIQPEPTTASHLVPAGPAHRIRARALDHALDHALVQALALVLDRDLAFDLALALNRVRALDRDLRLARTLVCDLGLDLVRALVRAFDLVRDLDLALALDRDLARDLARARYLIGDCLEGVEIDASGADLADLELSTSSLAEVLAGVVWDEDTRWPPNLRESILAQSEQIRPGVYRVRGGGTERDPHETAGV
jgi:hypothetical protein